VLLYGLRNRKQALQLKREAASTRFKWQAEVRCRPGLDLDDKWEVYFGEGLRGVTALRLKTRAQKVGFQGLKIKRNICTRRYSVFLDNVPTRRVARQIQREAKSARLKVTYRRH
jgi:hypothetical protein